MRTVLQHPRTAWLAGWAGVLAFLVLAVVNAVRLPVILDESAYLLDGYLFVTGTYQPFEAGGPYMSKMPLTYYLYGLPQLLFGPSLAVGRVTAVAFGTAAVVAVWLTLRRTVKPWIAVLGVWLVVFSPNVVRPYSQAFSQGMTACALAWSLYFLLDPKQRTASIFAGGFLATVAVLMRQNLAFYPFFSAVYVFLSQPQKVAWRNLVLMGVVFLGFHGVFFPGILRVWVGYLPFGGAYFQQIGLLPPPGSSAMRMDPSAIERLQALMEAIGSHMGQFSLLAGGLLLFRAGRGFWKTPGGIRLLFVGVSWLSLALIHAQASVGGTYCVSCLRLYLDFFTPLLVLLIGFLLDQAQLAPFPPVRVVLAGGWLLLLGILVRFGLNRAQIPAAVLQWPLPRFSGGRFQPGSIELYAWLRSLLGLAYEQALSLVGWVLPGLVLLALLAAALLAAGRVSRARGRSVSPFALGLVISAAAVLVFSYHAVFNAGHLPQACGTVPANDRRITAELGALLSPGDAVSWHGGYGMHTLAGAVGQITFHPPQINAGYSKLDSSERDALLAYGLYNAELEEEWLQQADWVVVQQSISYARLNARLRADAQFGAPLLLPPFCDSDPDSVFAVYPRVR